jgi:Zn-dependent protease with chaperone function
MTAAPDPGTPAHEAHEARAHETRAHETRGHPHDMDFTRQGRVHLASRQRWADATTIGRLLLHLPGFLISLILVGSVSYALLPAAGWVPVVLWIGSGVLVFHPPAESVFARYLLGLRYPTPQERARLEPVWKGVAAQAGVESRRYELWIEDSDDLNALAAAGHIVGVTSFSLNALPTGQLAAVLAHELAHHTGGHAWASLLGYWYALPGRLAWAAVRAAGRFAVLLGARVNGCAAVVAFIVLGTCVAMFALNWWFILLPLLAAPYLLAAVGRRAELRADRHAATLGYGPMLVAVLDAMHTRQQQTEPATALAMSATAKAVRARGSGLPARLLSSHPDYHTRLHHLRPFLEGRQ